MLYLKRSQSRGLRFWLFMLKYNDNLYLLMPAPEIKQKIKKLKGLKALNEKLKRVNQIMRKMPEKASALQDQATILELEKNIDNL